MRQALHIFRKDARHLWLEIAVVMILAAGFAFTGTQRAQWLVDAGANRTVAWSLVLILLPLAWWTLIARVIHAEALPGDRQFWTTRPYSWKSLLLAKGLFIVVFINIPMLLADAVIVRAYGLHPLSAQLPGLLWSQVLLTVAFLLPIAALSAVTAGFVQLIFAVLILSVIAFVFTSVMPEIALAGYSGSFEWVNIYCAFLVIGVGGLTVLVWQYSRRRTTAVRAFTVAMAVLAIVGMLAMPWPAAFAIQSLVSRQRVDSSAVRVVFDSGVGARAMMQSDGRVHITIPLDITGLPHRTAAKVEGFSVALEAPGKTVWESKQVLSSTILPGQEFAVATTISRSFYLKMKDGRLGMHGSLYLTLFGDSQTASIPFGNHPATVPRVGACTASQGPSGPPYFVVCSSGFRFPLARISYRFLRATNGGDRTVWSSTQPRLISYSPFPAALSIDPISQEITYSIVSAPVSSASVSTVEPLAYLRRSFEVSGLKLILQ